MDPVELILIGAVADPTAPSLACMVTLGAISSVPAAWVILLEGPVDNIESVFPALTLAFSVTPPLPAVRPRTEFAVLFRMPLP